MTSLGKFGVVHEPIDLSIDYFDVQIRVNPELSDLVLSDFGEIAVAAQVANDGLASMAAIKTMMRELIHVEDFDEFWSLARKHSQSSEDLQDVSAKIVEAASDRPTSRLSDSSPGQPPTDPNSSDESSLRVVRRFEAKGRPDIALMVSQASGLTG